MYPRTLKNYNAFVDGISYFGKIRLATLPELKIKTAAYRGAGMDAEMGLDQGMEAMSCELTFKEWLPALIKMFGTRQRIVLRPAVTGEDSFEADSWIFTLGGRFTSTGWDQLDPNGSGSELKLMSDIDLFRCEHNGEELFHIDVQNGIRRIGGEDQLASIRQAMGL